MECYLTGKYITDYNKSLEHILPNALGGKLKSRSVLSLEANLKLAKVIDTPFNKMFENIYRRLSLERDRPSTRGIVGIHQKYNKEIVVKDNKCFPRKPIFDVEKNAVYAQNETIGKGYIESLKKKGNIKENQEVKIWTDLSGEVRFNFKFDNKFFPLGFGKIAAGFATLKGVKRNNLKGIVNLAKNEFRNDIKLLPYFPITVKESILESASKKSRHYPLHTIVLKGIKKDRFLYCYIELFSTFQYVVIVDDDYDGEEIYHSYIYNLLNGVEIPFNSYIDSVVDEPILKSMEANYKDFSIEDLQKISENGLQEKERVRLYCHFKFHQLESFIAYLTLTEKMDILDKNYKGNK